MNILVIGSGGREHAIINYISKSNKCSKIFALPGNGGTESLAETLREMTMTSSSLRKLV